MRSISVLSKQKGEITTVELDDTVVLQWGEYSIELEITLSVPSERIGAAWLEVTWIIKLGNAPGLPLCQISHYQFSNDAWNPSWWYGMREIAVTNDQIDPRWIEKHDSIRPTIDAASSPLPSMELEGECFRLHGRTKDGRYYLQSLHR